MCIIASFVGVLLPIREKAGDEPWDAFPVSCVAALSKIVAVTGATIVLSSTWRATADSQMHIISEFKRCQRSFVPQRAIQQLV